MGDHPCRFDSGLRHHTHKRAVTLIGYSPFYLRTHNNSVIQAHEKETDAHKSSLTRILAMEKTLGLPLREGVPRVKRVEYDKMVRLLKPLFFMLCGDGRSQIFESFESIFRRRTFDQNRLDNFYFEVGNQSGQGLDRFAAPAIGADN